MSSLVSLILIGCLLFSVAVQPSTSSPKTTYLVKVTTGTGFGGPEPADSDQVFIKITGEQGETEFKELKNDVDTFKAGRESDFSITAKNVGNITEITIKKTATSLKEAWRLRQLTIEDSKGTRYEFQCKCWISKLKGLQKTLKPNKVLPPSVVAQPSILPPKTTYLVKVTTGTGFGGPEPADSDQVFIKITGEQGETEFKELKNDVDTFKAGRESDFSITAKNVGNITEITMKKTATSLKEAWRLRQLTIEDSKGTRYEFQCKCWISKLKGLQKSLKPNKVIPPTVAPTQVRPTSPSSNSSTSSGSTSPSPSVSPTSGSTATLNTTQGVSESTTSVTSASSAKPTASAGTATSPKSSKPSGSALSTSAGSTSLQSTVPTSSGPTSKPAASTQPTSSSGSSTQVTSSPTSAKSSGPTNKPSVASKPTEPNSKPTSSTGPTSKGVNASAGSKPTASTSPTSAKVTATTGAKPSKPTSQPKASTAPTGGQPSGAGNSSSTGPTTETVTGASTAPTSMTTNGPTSEASTASIGSKPSGASSKPTAPTSKKPLTPSKAKTNGPTSSAKPSGPASAKTSGPTSAKPSGPTSSTKPSGPASAKTSGPTSAKPASLSSSAKPTGPSSAMTTNPTSAKPSGLSSSTKPSGPSSAMTTSPTTVPSSATTEKPSGSESAKPSAPTSATSSNASGPTSSSSSRAKPSGSSSPSTSGSSPSSASPTQSTALTSPGNASSVPTTSTTAAQAHADFINDLLHEMNVIRLLHGAGPLLLEKNMSQAAQKKAAKLIKRGTVEDETENAYGIATCKLNGTAPGKDAAKKCVSKWYVTVKDFDWPNPRVTAKSSQFAQLVWKPTTHVGIGVGGTNVVVYFDPPRSETESAKDNISPVIALSDGTSNACPEGFRLSGSSCFKFLEAPSIWAKAIEQCAHHGATLASLQSQEENTFVTGLLSGLQNSETSEAWLGFNDRIAESSYQWVDGSVVKFHQFLQTEPTGVGENCVALKNTENETGWEDKKCTDMLPSLCRRPAEGHITYKITFLIEVIINLIAAKKTVVPPTGGKDHATLIKEKLKSTGSKKPIEFVGESREPGPNGGTYYSVFVKVPPGTDPDFVQPLQKYLDNHNNHIYPGSKEKVFVVSVTVNNPANGMCYSTCFTTCSNQCSPMCCSGTFIINPSTQPQPQPYHQQTQPGYNYPYGYQYPSSSYSSFYLPNYPYSSPSAQQNSLSSTNQYMAPSTMGCARACTKVTRNGFCPPYCPKHCCRAHLFRPQLIIRPRFYG